MRTALWGGTGAQIDFFDESGYGVIVTINSGGITLMKVTASGTETLKTWT